MWCELAEVKSAGLLETLDEHSKKLQEAFFEVITSEASYLRSINILITHFMAAPELMGKKHKLCKIVFKISLILKVDYGFLESLSLKLMSDF